MTLHRHLEARLRAAAFAANTAGPQPKRGADIFDGPYPRTWDEFIGQPLAREHLQAAIASSRRRGVRLEHVLIASGLAGIGKSSLARLIASELGAGLLALSGVIAVDEARTALRAMRDGDVLFIDEIHQIVGGNRARAEWLLHLLQDGRLLTARGAEPMPDVTVVAATTDAQKLPETILDRFVIQPTLVPYDEAEALMIASGLAGRMGFGGDVLGPVPNADLIALTQAANNAPRTMRKLLATYRDTAFRGEETRFDVDAALRWAGYTRDGLDEVAQKYLLVLVACEGRASLATIAGQMGEPGPLRHTEALLGVRGYITIEGNGRELTQAGVVRAGELLVERGIVDE